MKKIFIVIALILCAAMLSAVMTSCDSQSKKSSETATESGETASEAENAEDISENMTAEEILNDLKVKQEHTIDFENDLTLQGTSVVNVENGVLDVTTSATDEDRMITKQSFSIPFKVDITAKTDNSNIRFNYNNGEIILGWEAQPNVLSVRDIGENQSYTYDGKGGITVGEYAEISWIIHNDYMALIVDGEVRNYSVKYPYILAGAEKIQAAPFEFGTAWNSTLSVSELKITELE